MLRLLVFVVLFFVFYYLIKIIFLPSPGRKNDFRTGSDSRGIDQEMVQDPYCQVYLPLKESLKIEIEGKVHYFCSKECLRKYQEARKLKS